MGRWLRRHPVTRVVSQGGQLLPRLLVVFIMLLVRTPGSPQITCHSFKFRGTQFQSDWILSVIPLSIPTQEPLSLGASADSPGPSSFALCHPSGCQWTVGARSRFPQPQHCRNHFPMPALTLVEAGALGIWCLRLRLPRVIFVDSSEEPRDTFSDSCSKRATEPWLSLFSLNSPYTFNSWGTS